MHSMIQSGLIPGGRSFKGDRQSVFFTAVNPMYTHQHQEEVQYDLDKPRNAVYKNIWRVHQNTVHWCNLKLAQRKGLQFYQTRSSAIALFNTLPAICIEEAVYMKTEEEKFCKVYRSPRLPRAVFTPNLQHERQDPRNPEKRENPSTIEANRVCCTGKPVARFSRTHVACIPKKVSEASTGKPVAVTLITEFQVYLTQPS